MTLAFPKQQASDAIRIHRDQTRRPSTALDQAPAGQNLGSYAARLERQREVTRLRHCAVNTEQPHRHWNRRPLTFRRGKGERFDAKPGLQHPAMAFPQGPANRLGGDGPYRSSQTRTKITDGTVGGRGSQVVA
jgi:hypothetical protein